MSVDIDREIASVRSSKIDVNNYLSAALRKLQNELNRLGVSTPQTPPAAVPAAATVPPLSTASSPPLFVGGNAISISGTYPDLNIAADPATATAEGVVKLAQDIGGTADLPKVTGLQGVAVSTTAPTDGQVLEYVAVDSKWEPKTAGAGGGAWTLISKQVLASPAATITFSSISGSYNHLVLIQQARISDAVTGGDAGMQFNGDTGTNYDTQFLQGEGTAAQAGTVGTDAYIRYDYVNGSGADANTASSSETWIPNYAGTTFYKLIQSHSGRIFHPGTAADYHDRHCTGQWKSTAAITSIVLTDVGAGNFIAGSSFYLYGVT